MGASKAEKEGYNRYWLLGGVELLYGIRDGRFVTETRYVIFSERERRPGYED